MKNHPFSMLNHDNYSLAFFDSKKSPIPADTNIKWSLDPCKDIVSIWHAKNKFDLNLRETKSVRMDGHHATIIFVYKI